jgi:hypothetical protein
VNKNGVWARIIKNAFAPLFIQRVDFIAGNPPWINWESLPSEYRDLSKPLWERYGLVPEKGQLEKMRGGKKDLGMLFVYAAADYYLKSGGKLGYVIFQSLFKSGAASVGFRSFKLPGSERFLKVLKVDDLSFLAPFEGATNRTAIFICKKSKSRTEYPVPYHIWVSNAKAQIEQFGSFDEVLKEMTIEKLAARPTSDDSIQSAWITADPMVLKGISKTAGISAYSAREGANTGGLSGCYWIQILSCNNSLVVIENLSNAGKKPVKQVQTSIEPDFVYPLLRGRDVLRWVAEPKAYIIAPQDHVKQREGISTEKMKRNWPKTYSYFKEFEKQLKDRPDRKYYPEGSPFYTMRNVADYTRSTWKVVFKDLSELLQCAVIGPGVIGTEAKPIIPDLTLRLIPFESSEEAYFVAALLNSSPAVVLLHSSSVGVQTQRYHPGDIQKIALPKFDPSNESHGLLAKAAAKCHVEAKKGDLETLNALEQEIDNIACKIWGISGKELSEIRKYRNAVEKG